MGPREILMLAALAGVFSLLADRVIRIAVTFVLGIGS
jgi:hypothetical protein